MFKSLIGLVDDVATIATAPVKIAVDLTRTVTKPLADAAKDTAKAAEELSKDQNN